MTQEAATCPQLQHVFLGVGPDPLRALEDARRPVRFLLNAFLKAAHPRAPWAPPPLDVVPRPPGQQAQGNGSRARPCPPLGVCAACGFRPRPLAKVGDETKGWLSFVAFLAVVLEGC